MECLGRRHWRSIVQTLSMFNVIVLFYFVCSVSGKVLHDKMVLLEFKNSVSDPSEILSSWKSESFNYCSWVGITCNSDSRVVELKIPGGNGGNVCDASCLNSSDFILHGYGYKRNCSDRTGKLVGKLPRVIGKLSELRVLSLPYNELGGELSSKSEIWGLKNIEVLDLEGNMISGNLSGGFDNFRRLQVLNLSFNRIDGEIPSSLSECRGLQVLNLANNKIGGKIPRYIGNYVKLKALYLSFNLLKGSVPDELVKNCGSLEHMDLSGNYLNGSIPRGVGKCSQLRTLLLFSNAFEGVIPPELGSLNKLEILDVSRNSLRGCIPAMLGLMKNLRYLSLAGNRLNGTIPSTFSQLTCLRCLELSSNSFSGEIPQGLVNLSNLTVLLLSNNKHKLSGNIPPKLSNTTSLAKCDVLLDNMSRQILLGGRKMSCSNFLRNPFLLPATLALIPSGEVTHDSVAYPAESGSKNSGKGFSSTELALIISVSAIVGILLCLVVLFYYKKRKTPNSRAHVSVSSERKDIVVFKNIGAPLTYESVVQATGNFNGTHCIGYGGFGATYKAEVTSGTIVAVKRLTVERYQGVPQFDAEVSILGRIKHPNLITLIGYHASEAEMFLIYNFLPGGNLEQYIQKRSERAIDWRVLHKISLNVASALAYLHDRCNPRVLHRDIKPSNVLLDDEYNAYLSDFGLSRLLGIFDTHATTSVAGTYGYVAPEYALTGRVSEKTDVYSYGVMFLELLSDKKALDPSFYSYGNGFTIVSWASMLLESSREKEFFTSGLWEAAPQNHLVEILKLALGCSAEIKATRPAMRQVVNILRRFQPPPG